MSEEEKVQISKDILGVLNEENRKLPIFKDLARVKSLMKGSEIFNYEGFWVPEILLKGVVFAQRNFSARDDDIILASCPKAGTTWLKALTYLVARRNSSSHQLECCNDLLKKTPHDLVPFLEDYAKSCVHYSKKTPRILSTHIPFPSPPNSVRNSNCKIVYISRNPMDAFISFWHFLSGIRDGIGEPSHLEECFDMYCRGVHGFGPFWDHALGFWKASLERMRNVLFLRYEDMKENPSMNVKRLADFLGFSFSEEEEKNGVVEKILEFCSIKTLKNIDVNKTYNHSLGAPNSVFFRKGEVGDSRNFFTAVMKNRIVKLMKENYGEHFSSFELPF